MSLRNRLVLPFVLSTIAVLAGCGSSSTPVIGPVTGNFSNANLNGTYVFSVSGLDQSNAPFAMVGTFTANGMGGNGNGGISGGTVDVNDENTTIFTTGPIPNASIGSGTYTVSVDGRGRVSLPTSTPFGTVTLDVVLQDSSHGLVIEFDGNASGSGTLDLQSAGVSPVGTYAFSFSGADGAGNPFATVGNFTLGAGGITGLEDFNDSQLAYANHSLSGTVVLGPASPVATTLVNSMGSGEQAYDVYAIDANHLKFIEMDTYATLSGDAYSQNSTAVPTGSLAFTLSGFYGGDPSAAGGFMVTDGAGGISATSTEDVEDSNGTATEPGQPVNFSGQYSAAGTGRYIIGSLAGFFGSNGNPTGYVAYPYSAGGSSGLFLLEMDDAGILVGAAYPPQTAGATFNAGQGYALNLTGFNNELGTNEEVDDIAEFSAVASGATVTGFDDENFAPGGGTSYQIPLAGTYNAPDSNGRGLITATTSNSSGSLSTINGGYELSFYTVDGTTFPFIESDGGQFTAGVFVEQNATASASAAAAKAHMFVAPHLVKPHAAVQKKSKK